MKEIIRTVWRDIRHGENIDLYLTVFLAFTLTILNLFGLGQAWVTPIIMTVLALLAISSLANRYRLEKIINKLNQSYDNVLLDKIPPDFETELQGAEQVLLIGVVLTRTISTYYTLLQEKLQSGDKIKVLIVDPYGKANEIVGERTFRPMSEKESADRILLSLSNLCALKETAPENMEIRVIDFPLSFGFLATDLLSPEGSIFAEHYTYKMGDDVPIIVFRPEDRQWYDFFKKQINILWENGKVWVCNDED